MSLHKASLREVFRERRRALGAEARAGASREIADTLPTVAAYQNARGIAAYWPLEDEVDLRPFIAFALGAGKKIFLPRVNKAAARLEFCLFDGRTETLADGPFGLLEPQTGEAANDPINLVIVPGLAFDLHRHRLGYGVGYYDRFLMTVEATAIGVAFDIQTIDILPIAEHDVAMDLVVTESRVF
ncbi:MAG: 5-formyltetrahydrofolate cyclo-ligase [Actinomycetota bacterium]|nr:5-formyltetrahydrofolate cyclo-ligase [Actinomycetota bacterium]